MIIDLLCNDGSPLGITYQDVFGNKNRVGIGGAELALMTLLAGWRSKGHKVTLYNNPLRENESPFEQKKLSEFEEEADRDFLIIFRSPNARAYRAKGKKIWWSCDQYTTGGYKEFAKFVDKIVTISPFHSRYFEETYGIENTIPIDIPVRTWDYDKTVEKVPNRLIFTSVPDRGLGLVAETFPRIKAAIPDASLVITSDYRLWGSISPANSQYLNMFMRMSDVQFLGAVSRDKLIEEQLKAQVHYYPCVYDELFCIAVAESQVAGVLPITTDCGALETTNMGTVVHGDAARIEVKEELVQETIRALKNPLLKETQEFLRGAARNRFSLENIMKQWQAKVFDEI